jgi:hypothetical protein
MQVYQDSNCDGPCQASLTHRRILNLCANAEPRWLLTFISSNAPWANSKKASGQGSFRRSCIRKTIAPVALATEEGWGQIY